MTAAVKESKITKKNYSELIINGIGCVKFHIAMIDCSHYLSVPVFKIHYGSYIQMMRSIRRHCFAICNSSIRREL